MVTLLAAVAGIWAAPRASDAVQEWVSTPTVELRSATLPDDLPVAPAEDEDGDAPEAQAAGAVLAQAVAVPVVTIDAGMRFTMAAVTCTPPARKGEVLVRLRASEDGRTWTQWFPVQLERSSEEGGKEKAYTELIWTGQGRYLQVQAEAAESGGLPTAVELHDVRVVAVNTDEDADHASAILGVLRRTAAAIAGLGGAGEAEAMTSQPKIVSRSGWKANESWRRGSVEYAPVKMAFVHHTASGNSYSAKDVPGIVRGVYGYHTKGLGWNDIGYNFLIDRYGTIYEGRYGGITRGVIGAHVLGFNTGSTGVSLIGTYSSTTPSSKSIASLKKLLVWKLDVHHINPQGKGTLVCRLGQKYAKGRRVAFNAIAGHRNANYTTCPGGRLYSRLAEVRAAAAKTGHPKIYAPVVSKSVINPNGSATYATTTIGSTLSQTAKWTVTVKDAGGEVFKKTGTGKTVKVPWTGKDKAGDPLPDGAYTVTISASSAAGTARPATATVRLDTVPPAIKSASAPSWFSPNGDGQADVATVSFTPGEAGAVRVRVVDLAAPRTLRWLTDWKSVKATKQTFKWDGRVLNESKLVGAEEGPSTLRIQLRDNVGNITTLDRTVIVDRTLKLVKPARTTLSPNGDGVYDSVAVSFGLTRSAAVTVTVLRSGSTVRTFDLGQQEKGTHSVTWDGALDAGGTATSGSYTLKIIAEGEGMPRATAVTQPLTVDLAKPRLTSQPAVTAAYGKTAKVIYTVRDSDSATVAVTGTVKDAKGKTVATLALGWRKQGAAVHHTFSWKPRSRQTYTVTFTAKDRGGNRQATARTAKISVR